MMQLLLIQKQLEVEMGDEKKQTSEPSAQQLEAQKSPESLEIKRLIDLVPILEEDLSDNETEKVGRGITKEEASAISSNLQTVPPNRLPDLRAKQNLTMTNMVQEKSHLTAVTSKQVQRDIRRQQSLDHKSRQSTPSDEID